MRTADTFSFVQPSEDLVLFKGMRINMDTADMVGCRIQETAVRWLQDSELRSKTLNLLSVAIAYKSLLNPRLLRRKCLGYILSTFSNLQR